jgi:hypothetical protein
MAAGFNVETDAQRIISGRTREEVSVFQPEILDRQGGPPGKFQPSAHSQSKYPVRILCSSNHIPVNKRRADLQAQPGGKFTGHEELPDK